MWRVLLVENEVSVTKIFNDKFATVLEAILGDKIIFSRIITKILLHQNNLITYFYKLAIELMVTPFL